MSYWKSGSENSNKQKGNIRARIRMQLHPAVQSTDARTTTPSDYQATSIDTI